MTDSQQATHPDLAVYQDLSAWQAARSRLTGSIGFVATMGALHDGHKSLLQRSVAENTATVLSIYVNPTQFNNSNDLTHYPVTLDADLAAAAEVGVDYVILPQYEAIYADGFRYKVSETDFSHELCGANRAGHFTGVLTVVMKLLNLVKPTRAYFGEKDYQQYVLIRDMCDAFFMDVDIVPCPTVRECDGLAMSSRNTHLNSAARKQAVQFSQALRSSASDTQVSAELTKLGMTVDYVSTRESRRFGAVVVNSGEREVRLIDNVEVAAAS